LSFLLSPVPSQFSISTPLQPQVTVVIKRILPFTCKLIQTFFSCTEASCY
jgi:hypothetical protein